MEYRPDQAEAQVWALADLAVDQQVEFEVTISAADVARFADLTGDRNPVHMSDDEAKAAGLPGKVVHGMLTAAIGSRVCGMLLPGRDAFLLSQTARFFQPIPVDSTVQVSATLTSVSPAMHSVAVRVEARHADVLVMRQDLKALVRDGDTSS